MGSSILHCTTTNHTETDMSTERTVYDMHAFVDGKRVEVKNAKSYMEAIKLLQAKIDAIKAAKKGAQP
jgi:hypothetical protein